MNPDDVGDSDDDGHEAKFQLAGGRKRKSKKLWISQLRIFHVAQLRNFHVAQLQNVRYHRNNKNRIIAVCDEYDFPFSWLVYGSNIRKPFVSGK